MILPPAFRPDLFGADTIAGAVSDAATDALTDTSNPAVAIAMWGAMGILAVAVLVGLYRVATATDLATRAIVGDLVFFAGVGVLVLLGTLRDSAAVVDAAMLASLLGILATIALARIITRGRR